MTKTWQYAAVSCIAVADIFGVIEMLKWIVVTFF